MAITAKDVNKLRQMTGAGMMDCKKALVEEKKRKKKRKSKEVKRRNATVLYQ